MVGRELLRVASHVHVVPGAAHPARGVGRAEPLGVVVCAQELDGPWKGRRYPKVGGLHARSAELAPAPSGGGARLSESWLNGQLRGSHVNGATNAVQIRRLLFEAIEKVGCLARLTHRLLKNEREGGALHLAVRADVGLVLHHPVEIGCLHRLTVVVVLLRASVRRLRDVGSGSARWR